MNSLPHSNDLLRALREEREARIQKNPINEDNTEIKQFRNSPASNYAERDEPILIVDDDEDVTFANDGSGNARRRKESLPEAFASTASQISVGTTEDTDLQLAMIMQQEEDEWVDSSRQVISPDAGCSNQHLSSNPLTDDNVAPDAREMFLYYDKLYFGGALTDNAVVVEWSKKMTLCAGQCSYRGRGSVCRVALSEPLLKYRSSTEVKETLLHEMIHAWQFVSRGNRDRTDHGPIFLAKMAEVNAGAVADMYRPPHGYSVSVFHSFRDEVELHRKHWWSCARCGTLVKRAMNRPPTAKDCREYRSDPARMRPCTDPRCLWHSHASRCGGDFTKIRGPDLQPPAVAGKGTGRRLGSKRPAADGGSEDEALAADGGGGGGGGGSGGVRREIGRAAGGDGGSKTAAGRRDVGDGSRAAVLPPSAGLLLGGGQAGEAMARRGQQASKVTAQPRAGRAAAGGAGAAGSIDGWLRKGAGNTIPGGGDSSGAEGVLRSAGGKRGGGFAGLDGPEPVLMAERAATGGSKMPGSAAGVGQGGERCGVSAEGVGAGGGGLACPVCGRGGWASEADVSLHLDRCLP